jgi:RNA polymerase sigma-70 factor (ECF subfamily)
MLVGQDNRSSRDEAEPYALLFVEHATTIFAAASAWLGGTDGAEDIVQEVFVEILRRPNSFDPELGTQRGFLRGIARHRWLDRQRSQGARQRRDKVWTHHATYDSLEDLIADRDLARRLRQALAALPANVRIPIEMAYFSDMSYRAVAEALDLPEGTVKDRIRRGLRLLASNESISDPGRGTRTPVAATTGVTTTTPRTAGIVRFMEQPSQYGSTESTPGSERVRVVASLDGSSTPDDIALVIADPQTGLGIAGLSLSPAQAQRLARELLEYAEGSAHTPSDQPGEALVAALEAQAAIEQAKGMLMAGSRTMTATEASTLLEQAAARGGSTVAELADRLVQRIEALGPIGLGSTES